jgi:hypothetical protein
MRARLLAAALGLALAGGASCARLPRAGDGTADWSAGVAGRHAEADRLLDRGERQAALAVLDTIVGTPPGEMPSGEPQRVLLQDTYFRLARLELDGHRPQRAVERASAGLALGGGNDLFAANLLVVRGSARQALGQAGAALDDYQRALAINEILLQRSLAPTP